MIGYKVVTSGMFSILERSASVQYAIGKRVGRPTGCGPLAVFDSEFAATYFASKEPSARVFACIYKPSDEIGLWNGSVSTSFLPPATCLAEWVELIREIKLGVR